ncbi:MAG: hypothetical protein ABI294_06280 [Casimicrobiaceae bacterium]
MDADLPDPRVFVASSSSSADAPIVAHVEASLSAIGGATAGGATAAAHDRVLDAALAGALDASGDALVALFAGAQDPAACRHLWRRLARLMSSPAPRAGESLGVALFALPLVIVVGGDAAPFAQLPGTLDDAASVAQILRAHAALGGNETFALSNALVRASAIDLAELPRLRAAANIALAGNLPLALAPAPIDVTAGESVHLRFLVGSALCAPGASLFDAGEPGAWAMPLAKALAKSLAADGATVLALPRAPAALPQALCAGRLAQREVSAQIFVTNALRRMRASVGEPTAIVSAHRLDDGIGGGELRLSLSSPFSPRDAEGFRCPLFAFERVADAAAMLDDLLRDCRVDNVHVQPGIHADRDRTTGLTLLFKPDSLPQAAAAS